MLIFWIFFALSLVKLGHISALKCDAAAPTWPALSTNMAPAAVGAGLLQIAGQGRLCGGQSTCKRSGNREKVISGSQPRCWLDLELELELLQPHMAQKPVLRGEVGCACVACEVSVERGGTGLTWRPSQHAQQFGLALWATSAAARSWWSPPGW